MLGEWSKQYEPTSRGYALQMSKAHFSKGKCSTQPPPQATGLKQKN